MSRFHIKEEIRILGIDDSALISESILIVGAFFRGGLWLDGVMRSYLTRDGMDGTDTIEEMVKSSKHYTQIRIIMLDGITYGGFNTIDIVHLYEETGIPVIVLMREYPDFGMIRKALEYLPHKDLREEIIAKAGKISKVHTKNTLNPVYIQCRGIDIKDAARIVKLSATRSNIPEPLRVAHLIATGIILGESRGKA
ncbi:endonuclease dU [Methanolobus halotolerans]|uniref:UPF0215 protein CUN85_02825 n=1 Tax=Methanolobus halotolerans TaxID=2052935 RepID=A0A4E0QCW9_9EURY|nr:DUF99 family protein [Methanolobus halotolerans]TGC11097.1 hypothetical protein CUN85_02825 [Methanolobus halotolerans]